MRPRDAFQPLLMHINCCHQHYSLSGLSAPSPANQGPSGGGLRLLGRHESQDAPSTRGSDFQHSCGEPALSVAREWQARFAKPSGRQLGSGTATLSLASCSLGEIPLKGGLRPKKGTKALRSRETITFTR